MATAPTPTCGSNRRGEEVWVKYSFHSQQGVKDIDNERAEKTVGADTDYYLRDLFDAIERGDYPIRRSGRPPSRSCPMKMPSPIGTIRST
jgi:hypothetical protein